MGINMSLKIIFSTHAPKYLLKNLRTVIDEHGKGFHRGLKSKVENNQGLWDKYLLAD